MEVPTGEDMLAETQICRRCKLTSDLGYAGLIAPGHNKSIARKEASTGISSS